MAHEIDFSNNRANMAYVGAVPWHGLGVSMPVDATLDDWIKQAGFDWEILETVVKYQTVSGVTVKFDGRNVLYRSDTLAPLSVMSDRYVIVQPRDVMEFFRDLCNDQGLLMETAGMLKGGATYWALCRAPELNGNIGRDAHNGYVLLATSADGSMATVAKLTSVRVVCNNTLSVSLHNSAGDTVKTRHNTTFDARETKKQLGLIDFARSWQDFREVMESLQHKPVTNDQATAFFSELLSPKAAKAKIVNVRPGIDPGLAKAFQAFNERATKQRAIRGLDTLERCYRDAPGAAPGSAYGLVQGVTRYIDHERGTDNAKRLASAWFGQGEQLKQTALKRAIEL